MSDIVTLAKELVAADEVVKSQAFADRDARIAALKDELFMAEAGRAADLSRLEVAQAAAIAVGDEEAFAEGVAAERARVAAEAAAIVEVQLELPLEVEAPAVEVSTEVIAEVIGEYPIEGIDWSDEAVEVSTEVIAVADSPQPEVAVEYPVVIYKGPAEDEFVGL